MLMIKLDRKINMIKKKQKNSAQNLYYGRELVNNAFKSELFPLKSTDKLDKLLVLCINWNKSLKKVYNNIIKSIQI